MNIRHLRFPHAFAVLASLTTILTASWQPLAAQASARGSISGLKFAIEEAVKVRRSDPVWIANGGQLVIAPGDQRHIRAAADGASGRVYPSVTYRIVDGRDWLSLADEHPSMGTVRVDARAGVGAGRSGLIEWTVASGFAPRDGVTRGTIAVRSGTSSSQAVARSASAIVTDLYRGILLRDPDTGAQGFINTVDRNGVNGIFRVATDIARSAESTATLAQKGVTNEQRLAALYQHLQGRGRRDISVAEWERHLALLNRREFDTVVTDLLWSDPFFARQGLPRPETRPSVSDLVASDDARFRGQDQDGDGRITRAEWRGNAVSFANHDWNDDGVLSGLEVQAGGAAGTASERFTMLDRNRNGLLQGTEWPGRADDFARLDRNRDNAVSRAEFENPGLPVLSREDRFRALDTNGDSFVVVSEMRGADELFAQLDANHDNRVVLAEYLNPPSNQSRLQLFMTWDHDDNGYLVRGEWHADTDSFNALDDDLDGLVSLGEYLRG